MNYTATTPEARPEDRRAAADAGMLSRITGLLGAGSSYLGARLQLAGLEAKEAMVHYAIIVAMLIAALMVVVFGYIFLLIGVIFGLGAWLGQQHVWWIALAVALLHFGAAVAALMLAKKKLASPMFTSTIDEFKKDQQWLATTPGKRN